ncbi:MAG: hypothetical protein PHV27_12060, partial [Mesotoga sp.]|uniref:hypothetical protein n=1 Tax=Mesotoga sp. TaxID=2053577 RepID=UPI00262F8DD0
WLEVPFFAFLAHHNSELATDLLFFPTSYLLTPTSVFKDQIPDQVLDDNVRGLRKCNVHGMKA